MKMLSVLILTLVALSVISMNVTTGEQQLRSAITAITAPWWSRPHSLIQRHAAVGYERHKKHALNASTFYGDWISRKRARRDVPQLRQRFLEVLVVTDDALVQFHGEDNVEQYLYTQMYMVNELFHHHSLGASEINVHVVGIETLSDALSASIISVTNVKATLVRFCHWVEHRKANRHLGSFDIGVYITREQIETAGYAPVTGMCESSRSCAIVRDDGFTSSFIIAHEIGHIIGIPHDGYGNRCERNSQDGKIMGSTVRSSHMNYYWSECSRLAMERHLPYLKCLNNRPSDISWPDLKQPFGLSWSFDQQCRQEFGEGYSLCRGKSPGLDPCGALWCGRDRDFCKTKESPALPGTPCGRARWCMDGRCRTVKTVRLDGGWSSWLEWSACSRTCGGGVKYRKRTCTNPRPRNGGQDCHDSDEDIAMCSTKKCPVTNDIRQELCAHQNAVNFLGVRKHNWLPMESKIEERLCYLSCVSEETGDEIISQHPVIDGIFCSYDNRNGVCVRGLCLEVGCDFELNSGAREDRCGVCEGDGTTCTEVTGSVDAELPVYEYHSLAILLSGTRNLQVHEINRHHGAFSIGVRDVVTGKWILRGNKEHRLSQNFVLNGALFHYIDGDYGERLHAKGPLLRDVEIMVYSMSATSHPGIRFSFTVPMGAKSTRSYHFDFENNNGRFSWVSREWSECSVTCGEGKQFKESECMDSKLMVLASGRCQSPSPARQFRTCNVFPCRPHSDAEYRWEIRKWEDGCSTSCGKDGVQRAYVDCLYRPRYAKNDVIMDYRYCGHLMPPQHNRPCNNSPCTARWLVKGWSKCSVTCGIGVRIRKVYCDPSYSYNPNFECPSASKPPHTATCRLPDCPERTSTSSDVQTTMTTRAPTKIPTSSCRNINDKYCQRFANRIRCNLSRFRNACCGACQVRSNLEKDLVLRDK